MPTRRMKLMADYGCFPLWDVDEPANVNPKDLPLTADLKSALLAWADAYDRTLNQSSPLDSCFPGPAEEAAFEVEGKRLYEELRAQLGSAYEVWYYSDQQAGLLDRG